MAHTLTEVATFTPTVTVPDGTDPRSNAAEVIQGIAQSLANRTQSLKVVTDHAARTDTANTFTALNTFNAGLQTTTAKASGAITANGGIRADDGTVEVTSTLVAQNAVNVTGLLQANGGLGAADGSLEVVNSLVVNADAHFTQPHVYLDAGVDIVHPSDATHTQPQRLVQVDISRARVAAGTPTYDYVMGCWVNSSGSGVARLEIPILLPRATLQWSFQVIWSAQSAPSANVAEVYRWTRDYSTASEQTPANGEVMATLTEAQFTATVGNAFVEGGPVITTTFAPDVERWAVIVKLLDGTNNRLYGLRLQFWDPGPRNG